MHNLKPFHAVTAAAAEGERRAVHEFVGDTVVARRRYGWRKTANGRTPLGSGERQMRRVFHTVVLLFLATIFIGFNDPGQYHHRSKPFTGAGILPYAVYKGSIHVLLGYDPGRGWTSFGGAPEKVVSVADANPRWETRQETALREAFEECRMVVPQEELIRGLQGDRFFPKNNSPKDFITFTVKIRYRPVIQFARRWVPVNSRFSEKTNYAWIPLSDLRQMVVKGVMELRGSPGNNKLWHTFYQGLQQLLRSPDYGRYFPE